MRIVLDLQAIQAPPNRGRGIGRAYRSLVREIITQRGTHDIHVVMSGLLYDYADEVWNYLSDILPIDNFHVWHGIANVSWHQAAQDDVSTYYREINRALYQAFLIGLRPDVVLLGNFCDGFHDSCVLPVPGPSFDVPMVMICYDLIPLVYPSLYDDKTGRSFIDFYKTKLASLKNADHIFTISKSAQDDISRLLEYPKESITITGLGFTPLEGGPLTSSVVEDICGKYNIKKPYILFVSAQDPRKNHVGLIEAFARLAPSLRDQYQLVFAGSNFIDLDRLYAALDESGLAKSCLSIAVHPSDADLQALYRMASLGVLPSLYEGFGLGILESMAFGLPVVASNTSAMPEAMGREDVLFDPEDASDMAAKMARALTDEAFREDLVRFGEERAKQWDWAGCARRAILAFEQITSDRKECSQPEVTPSARSWAIDRIAGLSTPGLSTEEISAALAKSATAIELTYPSVVSPARPRLMIDVSEFVKYDYNTGIQRVIKCVVIEASRQVKNADVLLVYSRPDGIGYYYASNLQAHLREGKPRLPFESEPMERVYFAGGDILFHSELTQECVKEQRFYLQALRRIGVQTMFLVYDLIPITHPEFHVGHTKKTMLDWLSCVVQSDRVICISRATSAAVLDCSERHEVPFNPSATLDWFHLGGDFRNYTVAEAAKRSKPVSAVLESFRRAEVDQLKGKNNFLMVGTIEPRKGHIDMIKAMEHLWHHGVDVNLIVVGKVGWLDENNLSYIQSHVEMGRHLFLYSALSDAELNEIYELATCLLYASKTEGFGLPLIEAAQHRLPIISRDLPVYREVCGDHAYYFSDIATHTEIAEHIEHWLELHAEGRHPKSIDLPWLTWEESIRALLVKVFSDPDPKKRLDRLMKEKSLPMEPGQLKAIH